jgi:pyridoxine 5-phosphate synthase
LVKLSVNRQQVVASVLHFARRNSIPSVIEAVRTCIDAGAPGITVHPRADARHITTADVHEIAASWRRSRARVEFNIEGDPRPVFSSWCSPSNPISARSCP